LNLTKVTKKEVTKPGKHVLLPVHMKMAASSLLSFTGKGGVVAASNYAEQSEQRKIEARNSGPWFNTHSTDM